MMRPEAAQLTEVTATDPEEVGPPSPSRRNGAAPGVGDMADVEAPLRPTVAAAP